MPASSALASSTACRVPSTLERVRGLVGGHVVDRGEVEEVVDVAAQRDQVLLVHAEPRREKITSDWLGTDVAAVLGGSLGGPADDALHLLDRPGPVQEVVSPSRSSSRSTRLRPMNLCPRSRSRPSDVVPYLDPGAGSAAALRRPRSGSRRAAATSSVGSPDSASKAMPSASRMPSPSIGRAAVGEHRLLGEAGQRVGVLERPVEVAAGARRPR